jgi:hypothetical protein
VRRILEGEARFANTRIEEADDGLTAIDAVLALTEQGARFDFILMDFVMVSLRTSLLL